MKFLLISAVFLLSLGAHCQNTPKKVEWYYNDHGFPFGIDHLILSNDGMFFFTASTENGCILSKGNWVKRGNRLSLMGMDSVLAYPILKMSIKRDRPSDTLQLRVTDYFNESFEGFAVAFIYKNSKDLDNSDIIFLDSSGEVRVPKTKYEGYYFPYQMPYSEATLYDSLIQSYRIEPDISEISISINHPSPGALDRGIKLVKLGNGTFKIRGKGLYQKGKLVYKIWDK